jgi:hypothetical protein
MIAAEEESAHHIQMTFDPVVQDILVVRRSKQKELPAAIVLISSIVARDETAIKNPFQVLIPCPGVFFRQNHSQLQLRPVAMGATLLLLMTRAPMLYGESCGDLLIGFAR